MYPLVTRFRYENFTDFMGAFDILCLMTNCSIFNKSEPVGSTCIKSKSYKGVSFYKHNPLCFLACFYFFQS